MTQNHDRYESLMTREDLLRFERRLTAYLRVIIVTMGVKRCDFGGSIVHSNTLGLRSGLILHHLNLLAEVTCDRVICLRLINRVRIQNSRNLVPFALGQLPTRSGGILSDLFR